MKDLLPMTDLVSWRELIDDAFLRTGDTWDNVVRFNGDLNIKFDCGYGSNEGLPFTLWTKKYVYFPICYDGSEWVGSAPRNPCDEILKHQGG